MSVPTLLSCSELKAKLGQPVVVDGSWHMPASGRDPLKEFKEDGHIPGGNFSCLLVLSGDHVIMVDSSMP